MKPKITDKKKEKLMASIVREMNLPRLTESVRNGLLQEAAVMRRSAKRQLLTLCTSSAIAITPTRSKLKFTLNKLFCNV
jgi:hypothetical protein